MRILLVLLLSVAVHALPRKIRWSMMTDSDSLPRKIHWSLTTFSREVVCAFKGGLGSEIIIANVSVRRSQAFLEFWRSDGQGGNMEISIRLSQSRHICSRLNHALEKVTPKHLGILMSERNAVSETLSSRLLPDRKRCPTLDPGASFSVIQTTNSMDLGCLSGNSLILTSDDRYCLAFVDVPTAVTFCKDVDHLARDMFEYLCDIVIDM